jgi:phenylpropionate dioxygenase-like ring-hydroxylating dioxygenase large terminal subunit
MEERPLADALADAIPVPLPIPSDAPSAPVATVIDGAEAVVWRCADGRLGAVGRVCPHLDWDLVEAVATGTELVCPGHGWSIARDGRVFKRNEFGREDAKGTTAHWPIVERDGKMWVETGSDQDPGTGGEQEH